MRLKHVLKIYAPLLVISFIFITVIQFCVPVSQQNSSSNSGNKTYYSNKKFRTENYIYEDDIRTVQFYKATGTIKETLNAPVLPVHQSNTLTLEFDELGDEVYNYYFKIFHCNADWTKSNLNAMDYLKDYNEFLVTDYNLSMNSRTPYIHYQLNVPSIKKSGNYILMVYREGNSDDMIITRRFIVFKNLVNIKGNIDRSSGVKEHFSNHQVNFKIFYKNYSNPMPNPKKNLKVTIRQNYRWDNAIYDLKPLFVNDNEKMLDYTHFNLKNNFPALNEFRLFDLRRINSKGRRIKEIKTGKKYVKAWVMNDKPRSNKSYSQYIDINGQYLIGNKGMGRAGGDGEYVDVTFTLETHKRPGQRIYVFGALSNWKIDNKYLMSYNKKEKAYTVTISLKQGFYNYYYVLDPQKEGENPSAAPLEGSYFNTENEYDIIVYHRPIGARADKIIGYTTLSYPAKN